MQPETATAISPKVSLLGFRGQMLPYEISLQGNRAWPDYSELLINGHAEELSFGMWTSEKGKQGWVVL